MWLQSLSERQRRTFMDLAHNVVVSDGLLDPNEELMMDQFRREMALEADVEPRYIDLGGVDAIFSDRRSRHVTLLNLIHLSYVDGALEIEEECLLREVAGAFDVDDETFARLDNWVKRFVSLENEAKALL